MHHWSCLEGTSYNLEFSLQNFNGRLIVNNLTYWNQFELKETRRFWTSGVIGSYFSEDVNGPIVTVNGFRYPTIINSILWDDLVHIDVQNSEYGIHRKLQHTMQ